MSTLLPERLFQPDGCLGMETPQDYRKFAEECRRLAGRAENERHRATLEQMADVWLRLAAEAERKQSRPPD
jgi:hypothetical protein